jgi:putative peptidoglycan lipid II flippase
MKVSGLTLATTVSSIIVTIIMLISLNKKIGNINLAQIFNVLLKTVVASGIMGMFIFATNKACVLLVATELKASILSIIMSFFIGIVTYMACIHLFKVEEYMYMISLVKQKIKKG